MSRAMTRMRPLHWLVLGLGLVAICLSLWRLEGARAGIDRSEIAVGSTPATLYRLEGGVRRLVVISHGFAGSRPLMEAYALTLARAGHAVLSFDYAGHGRNTEPMRGDVDSIEGVTRQLIEETKAVIEAGLALPDVTGPVAILGHSMATDVIVRTALEEPRISDVIGISMFSGAITPSEPARLLAINGEWEPQLRETSVDALRLVDPTAEEGETATNGEVVRRVVAAPNVEHVAVLYSPVALQEARDWLGTTGTPLATTGYAVLGLMAGIVALGWPLSKLLPGRTIPAPRLPASRFAIAVLAPALIAPLIATQISLTLLPVLVADYLMIHFAIMGALQLSLAIAFGARPTAMGPLATGALVVWGVVVFGLLLDRYVASFWPTGDRWVIIVVLLIGTIPVMLSDALLSETGHAPLWRRALVKLALFGSLSLAVALDFEGLLFLLFIIPVIVLFFLIFGLLGRWVGRAAGPSGVGLALGVILAWALGVTFPLFVA